MMSMHAIDSSALIKYIAAFSQYVHNTITWNFKMVQNQTVKMCLQSHMRFMRVFFRVRKCNDETDISDIKNKLEQLTKIRFERCDMLTAAAEC